jgi:hypothetical protein
MKTNASERTDDVLATGPSKLNGCKDSNRAFALRAKLNRLLNQLGISVRDEPDKVVGRLTIRIRIAGLSPEYVSAIQNRNVHTRQCLEPECGTHVRLNDWKNRVDFFDRHVESDGDIVPESLERVSLFGMWLIWLVWVFRIRHMDQIANYEFQISHCFVRNVNIIQRDSH